MSGALSRLRVWIAFALLCSIWGSSYLFIRIGVREISPLALVALRLVIGALTVLAIAAMRRERLTVSGRQLFTIGLVGTINSATPFLLISWGETTVPSGLASVLNSTTPIFALLLAGAVLKDEPITPARFAGVLVGFVGVVVLLSGDLAGKVHWSGVAGQMAITVASLCYAAGAVLVRKTLRGVSSMTIAAYVLLVSTLEVLTLSLIFSPPPIFSMSAQAWLAVIWLGMLGSGLAFTFAYFILENWGANRYVLLTYVLPIIGLTLGAVFLHETIDWHIAAGSALVLGGIVLASVARGRTMSASTDAARQSGQADACQPSTALHRSDAG